MVNYGVSSSSKGTDSSGESDLKQWEQERIPMSVKSIVYSRLFLTLLMAGILVPWALSCGDGSLPIGGGTQGPSGLLGLVPGGYERVTRWEVSKLLSGEGLEDLQDEFQDSWEWLEEYGIFSDDLTELVVADDGRGNTLLLFAGELDFEGIRDDLDDAGFRDSTYRDVEVWVSTTGRWYRDGAQASRPRQ
jgi:hypothetical protein